MKPIQKIFVYLTSNSFKLFASDPEIRVREIFSSEYKLFSFKKVYEITPSNRSTQPKLKFEFERPEKLRLLLLREKKIENIRVNYTGVVIQQVDKLKISENYVRIWLKPSISFIKVRDYA